MSNRTVLIIINYNSTVNQEKFVLSKHFQKTEHYILSEKTESETQCHLVLKYSVIMRSAPGHPESKIKPEISSHPEG